MTIEDYILSFPPEIQERLAKIHEVIKQNAIGCEEKISYGMPSYRYAGRILVYFAAHKEHIGFYALPSGHTEFYAELKGYKQGKGSVQFPNNQDLPVALIQQIVAFRVWENEQKSKKKGLPKIPDQD